MIILYLSPIISQIGGIPLTGKAQTPYRHCSQGSTFTGRNSLLAASSYIAIQQSLLFYVCVNKRVEPTLGRLWTWGKASFHCISWSCKWSKIIKLLWTCKNQLTLLLRKFESSCLRISRKKSTFTFLPRQKIFMWRSLKACWSLRVLSTWCDFFALITIARRIQPRYCVPMYPSLNR